MVIESFAFIGCSNIKSIIIPNSVEKISEYAFVNCKSLKSVSISENVKYISKKAFAGCSENLTILAPKILMEINLPKKIVLNILNYKNDLWVKLTGHFLFNITVF